MKKGVSGKPLNQSHYFRNRANLGSGSRLSFSVRTLGIRDFMVLWSSHYRTHVSSSLYFDNVKFAMLFPSSDYGSIWSV
jgi:hypothetical protein